MDSPNPFRWAGKAGMLGGLPWALFPLATVLASMDGTRGRLGNVGFVATFVALALMLVGNSVEVASLTFGGTESEAGGSWFCWWVRCCWA